jgi:integrase/recombinase XerD
LTIDESEQLLGQPDVRDAMGLRDRAILETLYSTGVRRMEVVNLTVYDLDMERGTLMVRQGKEKGIAWCRSASARWRGWSVI